jgi:uncharacterized protein YdcH (DUF465 family)
MFFCGCVSYSENIFEVNFVQLILKNHMEKHDLRHEFPQFEQKITELKTSDNRFKNLFDTYHDLNKQVYRIESNVEAHGDEYLKELRHKRVLIKDQIYDILNS